MMDVRRDSSSPCVVPIKVRRANVFSSRQLEEEDGVTFQSGSDTEVLLYAYAKWAEGCLDKFNGILEKFNGIVPNLVGLLCQERSKPLPSTPSN